MKSPLIFNGIAMSLCCNVCMG